MSEIPDVCVRGVYWELKFALLIQQVSPLSIDLKPMRCSDRITMNKPVRWKCVCSVPNSWVMWYSLGSGGVVGGQGSTVGSQNVGENVRVLEGQGQPCTFVQMFRAVMVWVCVLGCVVCALLSFKWAPDTPINTAHFHQSSTLWVISHTSLLVRYQRVEPKPIFQD